MVKSKKAAAHAPTDDQLAFYQGWQPSTEARHKNAVESRRVQEAIRAAPKRCWFNARNAILLLDDYADAIYVEGWIILLGGSIAEHAWVVKDETIIDPTYPVDRVHEYFTGLEFHGRAGLAEFTSHPLGRKHRNNPFHWAFGWGGEYSPSYMKAFRDALEYQNRHFAGQRQECDC